jgi:hypothetical protein
MTGSQSYVKVPAGKRYRTATRLAYSPSYGITTFHRLLYNLMIDSVFRVKFCYLISIATVEC